MTAVELPPADRSKFLDHACGDDDDVRREVETLLVAHAREGASRPKPIGLIPKPALDPAPDEPTIRAILSEAIGSQYEILRSIGSGGMGAVYLARDRALDINVAIKALRPDRADAIENRERFRREARMAAAFQHPSIVPLHWYGEVEQLCFFVMRYMPGGTLAHRLHVDGKVPCDRVREILVELADALAYAHEHGVIHRDIKPANILFEDDGRPMLGDFGIAKVAGVDTLTPSGQRPGTPHYMSPEQLHAIGDVDARTDLYSLGLVAYAMILGREAIPGRTGGTGTPHRMAHDPVPIGIAAPSTPPELAAVITRCLEPDRTLRFPDARTLKEALLCADCADVRPVPEPVRPVVGFGQYALFWAVFWTTYALIGNHGPREVALTLIIAGLIPLGFAFHLWNVGPTGLRPRELFYISYWPPEWWGMWWPPMLRRPTDLWPQLPWQARAIRIALSVFFVGIPALVMAQSVLDTPSPTIAAAEYLLFGGTAVITLWGALWARAEKLPFGPAVRVLFGATMPASAWRDGSVARLLLPARGVRPPNDRDPTDYVRAVSDLASVIRGVPVAETAAAMSRRLLPPINRRDEEIATIERHASHAELERLATRRAQLEGEVARGNADLRGLLEATERELTVLQQMRRRRESLVYDRGEMFELIRGVWTHLCRVQEGSSDVTIGAPDPTVALESLCSRIERLLAEPPDQLQRSA